MAQKIKPAELTVYYKYVRPMAPVRRSGAHLLHRLLGEHFQQMLSGQIELHISPVYRIDRKPYYQIALDLDAKKGSVEELLSEVHWIISFLRRRHIEFHVEFTGNGYRIVSHSIWPDVNFDRLRLIAKKAGWSTLDYAVSFRDLPTARMCTYKKDTKETVFYIPTNRVAQFKELKEKSKHLPRDVYPADTWIRHINSYLLPKQVEDSSGMPIFVALAAKGQKEVVVR